MQNLFIVGFPCYRYNCFFVIIADNYNCRLCKKLHTGGDGLVFSSTVFLFLFLPITLIVYYNPFFTGRRFRNNFLLLASLFFYAWGEPVFVWLLILSVVFAWGAGLLIGRAACRKRKKILLAAGVFFHVGMLFVFKYATFAAREFGLLFGGDFSFINIALPIGISFFTFQLLSYLFDVYYGKAAPQKSILNLGLYVALFPQLIAGPIVRYDKIEKQIEERKETIANFSDGMIRFSYGLGKKVLIANYMAQIADSAYNMYPQDLSTGFAWLGAIAYTLQIYFDFSGYADMAVGLGLMFGFNLPENFNYPYATKSIADFWRRWNISLGQWFRDYVYIPMGGNRVGKYRQFINLFVVWSLTGIWHGANWTFLVWGLFNFALIMTEKITGLTDKLGKLSHLYAAVAIVFSFVIFRSPDLTSAARYFSVMFGVNTNNSLHIVTDFFLVHGWPLLLIAMVLSWPLMPALQRKMTKLKLRDTAEPLLAAAIFLLSLAVTVSSAYNPFIYFNF